MAFAFVCLLRMRGQDAKDAVNPLERFDSLAQSLARYDRAAVAFSGGVDSMLVLMAAKRSLGSFAAAVTVSSPLLPSGVLREAKEMASEIGVEHIVIDLDPIGDNSFQTGGTRRCYFCKKLTLKGMLRAARAAGFPSLVDGTNGDDSLSERPGLVALKELGVASPLAELGFTKEEVRSALKALGSAKFNKPSQSCLATRIAPDKRVELKDLERIDRAEATVKRFGFDHVRARLLSEDRVRIETGDDGSFSAPSDDEAKGLLVSLKRLGFNHIDFPAGWAMPLPQDYGVEDCSTG